LVSAWKKGLILPLSDDYKTPLLWKQEIESIVPQKPLQLSSLTSLPPSLTNFCTTACSSRLYSESRDKKKNSPQSGSTPSEEYSADELEDNIFDIVNQLNSGAELLTQQSEKDELD
jgi:hypothetical protein